jgi:hypothetical protein
MLLLCFFAKQPTWLLFFSPLPPFSDGYDERDDLYKLDGKEKEEESNGGCSRGYMYISIMPYR